SAFRILSATTNIQPILNGKYPSRGTPVFLGGPIDDAVLVQLVPVAGHGQLPRRLPYQPLTVRLTEKAKRIGLGPDLPVRLGDERLCHPYPRLPLRAPAAGIELFLDARRGGVAVDQDPTNAGVPVKG